MHRFHRPGRRHIRRMGPTAYAILLLVLAAGPAGAQDAATRFRVRFPASAVDQPITGRIYVMISRTDEREPRLQVGRTGVPFFGHDVEGLAPGTWGTIDGSELGFPLEAMTDLPAGDAALRFRGFSRVVIHPQRKQPEHFVYAEVAPASMWNPTRGLYTRYGDVRPLLAAVDDRFVIMGSGDELRLTFDAAALPEPPAGWRRDFLLFVDGWAKDGDANTAYSQTVEPLPYHGMPQYPYEAPYEYPADGAHNLYREHYNTRPALRLIRPLTEGTSP